MSECVNMIAIDLQSTPLAFMLRGQKEQQERFMLSGLGCCLWDV